MFSGTPSTNVQVWVQSDFKHVVYGYYLTLAMPLVTILTNRRARIDSRHTG
jgi:hypothetical protein